MPDEPSPARGALLALCDVWKSFGDHAVLRGVDLAVARGEVVTVLGVSGAGKTLLLKLLNGLVAPDRGAVVFDGEHVERMRPPALSQLRRRVGMVFQANALFDSLTIGDNVAYGLRELYARTMGADEVAARVTWALRAVGLADTRDLLPEELSGGMRKRAGIARAIALRPEVILYDDPTAGLDPINAGRIATLIALLRTHLGVTSLVATHDLRTAFAVSDRLALLHEGRLAAVDTVARMRESADPVVHGFLAGEIPTEPPCPTVPAHAA